MACDLVTDLVVDAAVDGLFLIATVLAQANDFTAAAGRFSFIEGAACGAAAGPRIFFAAAAGLRIFSPDFPGEPGSEGNGQL